MINDDRELESTQERISYFQNLLAQFRQTARSEEFPIVARNYRLEIEQMQQQVLDYLTRPVNIPAKAA